MRRYLTSCLRKLLAAICFVFASANLIAEEPASDTSEPRFIVSQSDSPNNVTNTSSLNGTSWRRMPVLDGGRYKPLDSMARETMLSIFNRRGLSDPATGESIDATAAYLAMLFEWNGWDRAPNPHLVGRIPGAASYAKLHQPDKWDREQLLPIESGELRIALGLAADQHYIAPAQMAAAKVKMPGLDEERPFLRWCEDLRDTTDRALSAFEKQALESAARYWSYVDHRMGNRLFVLPIADDKDRRWYSFAALWHTQFNDATDPTGMLRRVQELMQQTRRAYLAGAAKKFEATSTDVLEIVHQLGPQLGPYANVAKIEIENAKNQWALTRSGWLLALFSCVSLLLSIGRWRRVFYVIGWLALIFAMIAMLAEIALRMAIRGLVLATTMYESILLFSCGAAIFGVLLEALYRNRYALTTSTGIVALVLFVADRLPVGLNACLQPLIPVLRNNVWVTLHVAASVIGYAAFALAFGIANVTLTRVLFSPPSPKVAGFLNETMLRSMRIGVVLFAAGILLGGICADRFWGRIWSWDPKEVWALIALVAYLLVVRAADTGRLRYVGLAAMSVCLFGLITIAWYAVDVVMQAGLHSYGFGNDGEGIMLTAHVLQGLYLAAATIRYACDPTLFDEIEPPSETNDRGLHDNSTSRHSELRMAGRATFLGKASSLRTRA